MESATVCGRGLLKILISRNCVMVDGCLAYPERWIGDRVPNTLYLSPSLLQGIQSNMDIPVRQCGIDSLWMEMCRLCSMEHAVEDGDLDTDPLGGAEEQQVVPSCFRAPRILAPLSSRVLFLMVTMR